MCFIDMVHSRWQSNGYANLQAVKRLQLSKYDWRSMWTVKHKITPLWCSFTFYVEDANADKSIVDFNFQKYCRQSIRIKRNFHVEYRYQAIVYSFARTILSVLKWKRIYKVPVIPYQMECVDYVWISAMRKIQLRFFTQTIYLWRLELWLVLGLR